MTSHTRVAVIGAGPGGLAIAALLKRHRLETLVLDRAPAIGMSWRGHYDRLHLHTVRWLSGLPGLRIPRRYGRWVSRDNVIAYLEDYARHHQISVELETRVTRIERAPQRGWNVATSRGPLDAEFVVVATGYNQVPWTPEWSGREGFAGKLIHASGYRNGAPFRDKDVLVVGPGNTGAELAVDLVENGAGRVWLSARTPPNILRRQWLGVPTQALSVAFRGLPAPIMDSVTRALQRVSVGDLSEFGLPAAPRGVFTQVKRDGVIPILDVGLIDLVKQRRVEVVSAVEGFEGPDVLLSGGGRLRPAAVIAATGYRRGLEPLIGHLGILRPDGCPRVHAAETAPTAPGLFFMGFSNPISGNLRQLAIDAGRICAAIRGELASERVP